MSDVLLPKISQQPLARSLCDICGKGRGSKAGHAKCSKIRAAKWAPKWEAYRAEQEAIKQGKGKRYAG